MEEMNELTAEERARILQHELEAVYGSSSYKIGRAVTWLPRNAKRGLKYLLHNGPVISAKYIYTYAKYHKIANKDYAYWACLQKKDYPEALKKWFLETNYTHTPLDLEHPKSFSEKTQWLKLYGGFEDVYPLVDKYAVREWVKEKIGEEYLIPLLGVWDRFDDIDFDKLPDKFMLKVNHGAGWNIAVQDKSKFDKADAKRKIEGWLKLNYCYLMGGLDVQYIHIKPRIMLKSSSKTTAATSTITKFSASTASRKLFCILRSAILTRRNGCSFWIPTGTSCPSTSMCRWNWTPICPARRTLKNAGHCPHAEPRLHCRACRPVLAQ